ncbi:hypothetical protein BJY04DRAFT_180913 [Aspergillus karnatakaensis]|uniref:uncharacterized protein n=1 Tax=Aspergillus karnatakaensis TaxID=1810916 RepID=UPI003CCC9726
MEKEQQQKKNLQATQRRYNVGIPDSNTAQVPTTATLAGSAGYRNKRPRAASSDNDQSDGDHGNVHHSGRKNPPQVSLAQTQSASLTARQVKKDTDPRLSRASADKTTNSFRTSSPSASTKPSPPKETVPGFAQAAGMSSQTDLSCPGAGETTCRVHDTTVDGQGGSSEFRRPSTCGQVSQRKTVSRSPTMTDPVAPVDRSSMCPPGPNALQSPSTEGAPFLPSIAMTSSTGAPVKHIPTYTAAAPGNRVNEAESSSTAAAPRPGAIPLGEISLEYSIIQLQTYMANASYWLDITCKRMALHSRTEAQARAGLADEVKNLKQDLQGLRGGVDAAEKREDQLQENTRQIQRLEDEFNAYRERVRNA